jgi:hypothetical protein
MTRQKQGGDGGIILKYILEKYCLMMRAEPQRGRFETFSVMAGELPLK